MYHIPNQQSRGLVPEPHTPVNRTLEIPVITDVPSSNNIEELYGYLGDRAVLIPMQRGTKIPMRKGWQDTTLEETRELDYVNDLVLNNVAVLVGSKSGNLIDIDCDNESFMNDFIQANGDLCRKTLQTKGQRGCHFWFRMKGEYPMRVENFSDEDGDHVGEFRGGKGNSMISGTHPSGCEYQILNRGPALEIEFSQIKWPEGYSYPWDITVDQEIAQRVGPAFEEKKGKATRINAAFFAEWVMASAETVYDEGEASFFLYDPITGLWSRVTDSAMAEVCWTACQPWLDQQDPAIVDSLKLLFNQRARTDIVAMLKSKVATTAFFTSGDLYGKRDKYFHSLDGMMRCLPEAGETDVTYLTRPFGGHYRSRFRFPCRYVEEPKCPNFDRLITSAFGEENVPFVLKVLGYQLIDGNPGQHIVVIKGPARSGKSQLALVMKGIHPDRSWGELRTSQLDGRFEIGAFASKRLVYGPDVRKDFFCVDGARNLKALTGGDFMEAEMKFANERVTVSGDKHVLVTTNDVMRLAPGEDIGAWRRRLIILETRPADLNQIVVNLGAKILADERDAVFTKLMNAAYSASYELATSGMLNIPEQFSLGGSNGIILTGDVSLWASSCISDGGEAFSTKELYLHHSNWCASRGETPVSQASFEKMVRRLFDDLGFESSHSLLRNGTSCNGYRRLEVKP